MKYNGKINTIKKENIHYFINDRKFKKLVNYKIYKYSKYDIKEYEYIGDIEKLKIIDMLRSKLGLNKFENPLNKLNKINMNDVIQLSDKFKDLLIKTFRLNKRKKKIFNCSRIYLTQLFAHQLSELLGIAKKKRVRFNYKIYQFLILDEQMLKQYEDILSNHK